MKHQRLKIHIGEDLSDRYVEDLDTGERLAGIVKAAVSVDPSSLHRNGSGGRPCDAVSAVPNTW